MQPLFLGLAGLALNDDERALFRAYQARYGVPDEN